jgi:hypothetical protein
MSDAERILALQEMGDAAADCVRRLERLSRWLDALTADEALAWSQARQACDRLYLAVNKP